MAQITIEVSQELAQALALIRDRLPAVLGCALHEPSAVLNETYRDILKFLTSSPSPQDILHFRPAPATQERLSALLEKNRDGELLPVESAELAEYLHINDILTLLKTQTFKSLQATS